MRARRHHTQRHNVEALLTTAGVTATRRRQPDRQIGTAAVIAAYQAGAGLATVARDHHHSIPTVRKILRAAGIPIRVQGHERGRLRLDIDPDQLVAARRNGATITELAEQHHTKRRTIQRHLAAAATCHLDPTTPA